MSPRARAANRGQVEAFFRLMLTHQFPHLMGHRTLVVVNDRADYLFIVQPYETGVAIEFSNATAGRADLADIVHEAGTSAERHVHGLTHATRSQLAPIDWWIWRQRQLPCSE